MIRILEQLERDERYVGHAYQDSEGYWTIGIGRLIDPRRGGAITHDEALYLLQNDVAAKARELEAVLPWIADLDEARRGVLLNMAFNLGTAGLLGFEHFLEAMRAGAWDTAGVAMLDSKWAKQVGARATRLRAQVVTGEWQ